jgi:hypothetical protein
MQVAADHCIQITDDLWAKVTGPGPANVAVSAFSGEASSL